MCIPLASIRPTGSEEAMAGSTGLTGGVIAGITIAAAAVILILGYAVAAIISIVVLFSRKHCIDVSCYCLH